jgi:zinc finger protein CreA/MIG
MHLSNANAMAGWCGHEECARSNSINGGPGAGLGALGPSFSCIRIQAQLRALTSSRGSAGVPYEEGFYSTVGVLPLVSSAVATSSSSSSSTGRPHPFTSSHPQHQRSQSHMPTPAEYSPPSRPHSQQQSPLSTDSSSSLPSPREVPSGAAEYTPSTSPVMGGLRGLSLFSRNVSRAGSPHSNVRGEGGDVEMMEDDGWRKGSSIRHSHSNSYASGQARSQSQSQSLSHKRTHSPPPSLPFPNRTLPMPIPSSGLLTPGGSSTSSTYHPSHPLSHLPSNSHAHHHHHHNPMSLSGYITAPTSTANSPVHSRSTSPTPWNHAGGGSSLPHHSHLAQSVRVAFGMTPLYPSSSSSSSQSQSSQQPPLSAGVGGGGGWGSFPSSRSGSPPPHHGGGGFYLPPLKLDEQKEDADMELPHFDEIRSDF